MGTSVSSLFPSWLTGLFGGAPQQMTGYAPSMTAGQQGVGGFVAPTNATGAGTGSNLTSTVQPTTAGGGQQIGGDLASALKGVNTAANQQNQQQGVRAQYAPEAQSQAGRPSGGQGLSNLLQLLNARTNMYMGATNPLSAQPQAQTQKQTGLLGF